MKKILPFFMFLIACGTDAVRLDDDTFSYKNKVYRVVDNEVLLLNKLDGDIKEFSITRVDSFRDMGEESLSFIKKEARISLKIMYRGSLLYYSITLYGFQKDLYKYGGVIAINFYDKHGFILCREVIAKNAFSARVGLEDEVKYHLSQGRIEMSSGLYEAIDRYIVSSTF